MPRVPARASARQQDNEHAQQTLGASERFFVALRRFTPINVTRVVALSGTLPPEELVRALRALQARHPLLRARVAEDDDAFVHDAAPPVCLQVMERRDDQHYLRVLEQVLNTRLALATQRLFAFYYLYSQTSQRAELILAGEHSVCDGVSMNQLCAELLALAARAVPIEVKPVLPVLERMLPAFPLQKRLGAFGSALFKLARIALIRRGQQPRAYARTTAFDFVTLTRQETAALVQRARAEQTTVTGALMAALLLTLRELHPAATALSLSVPINLRPRLPAAALGADDLGNYTSAAYLSHAARADLWPLARSLKAELDAEATGERLLAAAPLVYRAGRLLVRQGARPLAHGMLSNSGLVALRSDYGAFRPIAFYSATSAPILSADVSLFCNTFAGRLTLNLLFAEEVVSRRLAARIAQSLRQRLASQAATAPGLFTAA